MANSSDESTRYNRRQVALILKLAAESEGDTDGLTLAEIETIAAEAGIAPAAVGQAVRSLSRPERGVIARLLGAPTAFALERTIDGEIEPRHLVELVDTAKWRLGRDGDVRSDEHSAEWTHQREAGPLTLLQITRLDGKTRIRLAGGYETPAAMTVFGGSLATGLSLFGLLLLYEVVDPSLVVGWGLLAGTAVGAVAGLRAFWRGVARRADRQLKELGDQLAHQAKQLIAPATRAGEDPPEA